MAQNLVLPGQLTATTLTNSLGADVLLNNTVNFFDGPSVAQGTTGTWLAIGTVTMQDSGGAAASLYAKLWDGTTVVASGAAVNVTPFYTTITLAGIFSNPAGNIRISGKDASTTNGKFLFNQTGASKDCTLTVVRIGA